MNVISLVEDPSAVLYLKRCLWPELLRYTYPLIVLIGKSRPILVEHPPIHQIFIDCLSTEATVGSERRSLLAHSMLIVMGREKERDTDTGSWDRAGVWGTLSENVIWGSRFKEAAM